MPPNFDLIVRTASPAGSPSPRESQRSLALRGRAPFRSCTLSMTSTRWPTSGTEDSGESDYRGNEHNKQNDSLQEGVPKVFVSGLDG